MQPGESEEVSQEANGSPAPRRTRPALARQRQAFILERVREDGGVRVADLVKSLGVSDMTVRRDLEILQQRGLLEKVHGGAALIDSSPMYEPGFTAKSVLMEREKQAIAESAAGLIEAGTAIAISAGTTTYALAQRLVDVPGLTVLTNSVPVADVLHREGRPDQTIILSGGVRTPSDALVGPFAVSVIHSLHVDTVFMGIHGMDIKSGFTTPNILEAETNRALIDSGRRLVVLADHSKWGVVGISSIGNLDRVDVLFTDSGIEMSAREALSAAVRKLVVVDAGSADDDGVGRPNRIKGVG